LICKVVDSAYALDIREEHRVVKDVFGGSCPTLGLLCGTVPTTCKWRDVAQPWVQTDKGLQCDSGLLMSLSATTGVHWCKGPLKYGMVVFNGRPVWFKGVSLLYMDLRNNCCGESWADQLKVSNVRVSDHPHSCLAHLYCVLCSSSEPSPRAQFSCRR
jgi:hypothetical protein